jgi:hypothetical protein
VCPELNTKGVWFRECIQTGQVLHVTETKYIIYSSRTDAKNRTGVKNLFSDYFFSENFRFLLSFSLDESTVVLHGKDQRRSVLCV